MRLAFTSCMSAYSFPDQPVWDQIVQAQCAELVLLGDSAYYDCDGASTGEIQEMSATDFAVYAHQRFYRQVSQPRFAALVQSPTLRTHAIWDDHDFLWNNACGAQIAQQPQYRDKLPPTRAVFKRFRDALANRLAPGSFPAAPPPWPAHTPPPGYSNVPLGNNVLLHLTDGRSYKTYGGKDALLGSQQFADLKKACEEAPEDTVHLLASGVVFERRGGESWLDCKSEHGDLLALARNHRILILSGDVHHNNITQYATGGKPLFEATASGAAVCTAVTLGALQCNWGLLDIDATRIGVTVYQPGAPARNQVIDRATWQWVALQG